MAYRHACRLEDFAQHTLRIIFQRRNILDLIPSHLDLVLFEQPADLEFRRIRSCISRPLTGPRLPFFLFLLLILLLDPLQNLTLLHTLQEHLIFLPGPCVLNPPLRLPLRPLPLHLLHQIRPLEALQVLHVPHVVMVPPAFLPAYDGRIQRLRADLCRLL